MTSRSTLFLLALLAAPIPAANAAELPQIKLTDSNKVLACATPGRLMAYLKSNNAKMPEQFEGIATEYMRHGQTIGVRWDYAFFQMLVETGYLKFTGDVDVKQNNFAGLGATGKGAKGESFPDVSTGVKAHLQHILMYTGTPVEDPVAQRTRDVQAWGVLTKWQATIKRPMTFKDLTSKWAPTSKAYPRDIVSVAERFEDGICKQDDPQPELVAEAGGESAPAISRPKASKKAAKGEDVKTAAAPETASTEQAETPPAPAKSADAADAAPSSEVQVLNQNSSTETESPPAAAPAMPKAEEAPAKTARTPAANSGSKPASKKTEVAAAMTGAAAADATEPPPPGASKCKVWQASYGGSKAIIIKAQAADKMTNYTVLDVNDGSEKREADAYIAAYAKGGSTVGEFNSSAQALEKAFQLCPEG